MKSDNTKVLLTTLLTLLGQLVSYFIYFITIPIFHNLLGERLFGIYQFTQKLSVFGGVTNLGASSYLKIRLSSLRLSEDSDQKRLAIGNCLAQWAVMLPLIIPFCLLGYWIIAGRTTSGSSEMMPILLLLALIPISHVLSIPNVSLFASNLGFRTAHIAPLVGLMSAAIGIVLLHLGYSLSGVAFAAYIATFTGALISFRIAKRHLFWFGIKAPTWTEIQLSMKGSIGASVASIGYLGLQQLEALTVGIAIGPEYAGKLVITGVWVHTAELAIKQFVNVSIPALSAHISARDTERIEKVRSEIFAYISIFFILAGPPLILLTGSFVRIWVGEAAFLSAEIVCLLLIIAYFRILGLFDSAMLDQIGDFISKSLIAFLATLLPLGIAFAAADRINIVGATAMAAASIVINFVFVHYRCAAKIKVSQHLATAILPLASLVGCTIVAWHLQKASSAWQTQAIAAMSADALLLAILLCVPQTRRSTRQLMNRFFIFATEIRRHRR